MSNEDQMQLLTDCRLPIELRCGDSRFICLLMHAIGEGDPSAEGWAILPSTMENPYEPAPEGMRLCEKVRPEQARDLLLCLVAEYPHMIEKAAGEAENEFYTNLRSMAIESLEKFFPGAQNVLTELRLNSTKSNVFYQLVMHVLPLKFFIGGRLFQFHVERMIDKDMSEQNADPNLSNDS